MLVQLQSKELLQSVIIALSSWTRNKYDTTLQFVSNLLEDLKYIGQTKAMRELVNNTFDVLYKRIVFYDGTNTYLTFFIGENINTSDHSYIVIANTNIVGEDVSDLDFIAMPDEMSLDDLDFYCVIPDDLISRREEIYAFLKRYVFYGVTFKVMTNSEYNNL
jgi:hypothetical protein